MPNVNLNISEEQFVKLNHLVQKLKLNRSAYIREAINHYLKKTELELLAEQFKKASRKCRDDSINVCREFENIYYIPE